MIFHANLFEKIGENNIELLIKMILIKYKKYVQYYKLDVHTR